MTLVCRFLTALIAAGSILPAYAGSFSRTSGQTGHDETSVHLYEGRWTPLVMESEYDLPRIEASLSFDSRALYMKAVVHDAHFKDGERSWRYGDGFFITVAAPADENRTDTDRYYSYGFSLEKGEPIACLVNHDGTYFLKKIPALAPEISIDRVRMEASYTITIPWTRLYPFHPLHGEAGGINVVYISQNDDHSRRIIRYVPGVYDSEATAFRAYAPLTFHRSEETLSQMTAACIQRLITADDASVEISFWSPEETTAVLTAVSSGPAAGADSSRWQQPLKQGMNRFIQKIPLERGFGEYRLELRTDSGLYWQDNVIKYDRETIISRNAALKTADRQGGAASAGSIDALQYRFADLQERLTQFNERSRLTDVSLAIEETDVLYSRWQEKGSIYTEEGYLLSAFRSPRDSTLQPFSLILPENFTPETGCVLVVGLHGSGVDETAFIKNSGRAFVQDRIIFAAPRGRGLSDWWTGQTEEDAVDLIGQLKDMFKIEKTICYGFSMGGYGTWRLSMLYPELFDAAVVISGIPENPRDSRPEYDMKRFIRSGSPVNYLVIHGTDDRSLPIGNTDAFVALLKDSGYTVEYTRVEGGGHGDFFHLVPDMLGRWQQKYFSDR